MKELGKRAATKKGLSPTVILLGVFALIILILCVSLTPKSKQENEGSTSDVEQTPQNGPSSENAPIGEDNSPSLPNNVITKDARLTIEEKILNFPSGGCVSYGYPILQLKDNALADTINATLHNLVDTVILPKANELYNEDAPGSKRHYDYRLTVSDKYYSVIVTVDIQEGITSDLQAFSWNFSKEDGKIFDLTPTAKTDIPLLN